MIYLRSFELAHKGDEDGFCLSYPAQLEMACYDNNNVYPFKIFPQKSLELLTFEPITILYGKNGSGKSTLLNLIAEKLRLSRVSHFNYAPCMPDYLALTKYSLASGVYKIPPESRIITSDDVFDFLLDLRAINAGIDNKREELFREYNETRDCLYSKTPFRSLDDLEQLRRQNEAKHKSKSQYTAKRLPKEIRTKSNGESAYAYFTEKINENALYLLDEPENSLSAELQIELSKFISDSARFYGCQFIISTHSPFLLATAGALIYDLDCRPVSKKRWTELEAVRTYYDFFESHRSEFR